MSKTTIFLKTLLITTGLGMSALYAQTTPATPTLDSVVATVNDTEITLGHMIAIRDSLPEQYQSLPDDVLFKGIMDQLVQQSLLTQIEEKKLTKMDQLQLENSRREAISSIAIKNLLANAITDQTIQQAYDAKYRDFKPGTEYNAKHILVDSEEKAKEIKAKIEGGVTFEDAAKTYGTDGTAANGGDLGWFGEGMMVKPFEDAVATMKPGQVAGPIKTDFGWHLIKLVESRPAKAPALDDVRDELANELEQKTVADYIDAQTKAAKITRPGDSFNPAILKDPSLIQK